MKKVVVLTGAGISAESGIKTFRDGDGLWEGHDVMQVASPAGFERNPPLVFDFYNQRRRQAQEVKPNAGHDALVRLEEKFDVTIITQNVDELHEQAGSSKVIHLHGKLSEAKSTFDDIVYPIDGYELNEGDLCPKGHQLRPNIVWFGEEVPMMEIAITEAMAADVFMVIGTSLVVYPAAGLINYVNSHVPKYIIDPAKPEVASAPNLYFYTEKGTTGVPKVVDLLTQ